MKSMKTLFKSSTKGSKTKQKKKAASQIKNLYQLLLGKQVIGGRKLLVKPAVLTDKFEEVLETEIITITTSLLKKGI